MRVQRYLALFVFALAAVSFFATGFAAGLPQVETQQYKQAQFKVEYPQFTGIEEPLAQKKINEDIKRDIEKFIASCKENSFNKEAVANYKVHYAGRDKLSFEILTYTYAGGAHGASYVQGYTYDLKTGNRCALTELFDYRPSEINRTIFQMTKTRDLFLYTDFKGIKSYPQNFYLNKSGKAVFLFQQYEIAPYSSGIIRVEME